MHDIVGRLGWRSIFALANAEENARTRTAANKLKDLTAENASELPALGLPSIKYYQPHRSAPRSSRDLFDRRERPATLSQLLSGEIAVAEREIIDVSALNLRLSSKPFMSVVVSMAASHLPGDGF